MAANAATHVCLWEVPPKSPVLDPIEMSWAWARHQLRLMVSEDMRLGRAPLGKAAYTRRVEALVRRQKAQTATKQCAMEPHSTRKVVVVNGGAAIAS